MQMHTKFGKSILGKIIKIVATGCHVLKVKCTKFDFGLGSAPDPAGGAYSATPDPVAWFKGPSSEGEEEGMGVDLFLRWGGGEMRENCFLSLRVMDVPG